MRFKAPFSSFCKGNDAADVWDETSYSGDERRCHGCGTNEQTLKIELLSQWKLEAEFRNRKPVVSLIFFLVSADTCRQIWSEMIENLLSRWFSSACRRAAVEPGFELVTPQSCSNFPCIAAWPDQKFTLLKSSPQRIRILKTHVL